MLTKSELIALEENMNNLLMDEKIKKRRTACSDFVMDKLMLRAEKTLVYDLGITEDIQKDFLENDMVAFERVLEILKSTTNITGLSERAIKQINTLAYMNKKSALDELKKMLIKKERIALCKEIKLNTKVFLDFIYAMKYTSEKTIEKLSVGLNLTEEEKEEMKALNMPRYFYLSFEFRNEIYALREATGMGVEDFLIYSYISTDAWRKISEKTKEESNDRIENSKKSRTSQGTLLKLITGFGFEADTAKAFLNKAGSDFVMVCDLAFLTAITTGYKLLGRKDPTDVMEIVDYLSSGRENYGEFSSPYKE